MAALRPTTPRRQKPPADAPAPPGRVKAWLTQFWGDLTKNTSAIVVGALLAGGSSVALFAWNAVNGLVDNRVADILTRSMSQPDSMLSQHLESFVITRLANADAPLHKAMAEMLRTSIDSSFSSTVGALAAGRILLTSAAPAQSIYVYAPDGHKVRLLLKVKNLAEGDSVRVVPRNGRPMSMSSEGLFDSDVTALLDSQANDAAIADILDIRPSDGEFENLYSLRVQLSSAIAPPAAVAANATPTEVEYMTLVTPAIRMGTP
jgi:hypothetical protein